MIKVGDKIKTDGLKNKPKQNEKIIDIGDNLVPNVTSKENELDFSSIINIIQEHRIRTYRKINEELVMMYYEIGQYLSEKMSTGEHGDGVISTIASKIKETYPILKGFSKRGLYQMIQFYETYKDNQKVRSLVAQLNWTNNLLILRGTKSMEEKEFYIKLCIKNNYSKRELDRQIESHYYERYMLSNGHELESVEPLVGEEDFPNTRLLDSYSLEFLDLPNNYKEKDLKNAIMSNLKNFILEIGKDFTFKGEEYRINVGGEDFYIDLLFYNRTYSCLVAFELKVGKFKPEFVSKMDFYLAALDKYEKKENENPSIGVILCASKNDAVVELASSRSTSTTAVSTYSTNLIDTDLLKNKLIEYQEIFDADNQDKED